MALADRAVLVLGSEVQKILFKWIRNRNWGSSWEHYETEDLWKGGAIAFHDIARLNNGSDGGEACGLECNDKLLPE